MKLGKANNTLFNETTATANSENKDKILLIDADTVAYAVCSVCESGDDEVGYIIDLEYALSVAIEKVTNMLLDTGCESAELHFTRGKNFRYDVSDTYKSNRTDQRTPEGLSELKELLVLEFEGSIIHYNIEADDHVVWAKKYNPDKYVLAAVDKDVYNSVAGVHWNYFARAASKNKHGTLLKEIKPHWVEVSEPEVLVWFYMQVLMGDHGDGIKGVKGCGPAKALKILVPDILPDVNKLKKEYKDATGKAMDSSKWWELTIRKHKLLKDVEFDDFVIWDKVVTEFESSGLTKKDAIMTARLVSMNQLNEKGELELWTEPILK